MKLRDVIAGLSGSGECAFMPYVCAGDPNEETCLKIVDVLVSAGADAIEFGLAFSDPIADGPTIQRASQRALSSGMNTEKYFRLCEKISAKHTIPLIAMSYYNLILQYGLERFALKCAKTGVYGIIVPDLPIEESSALKKACNGNNIDLIFLVAPTTTSERLSMILDKASGFIYLVSLLGVTGAREKLGRNLSKLVEGVKRKTRLPLCLGFGISKPAHVQDARAMGIDGVILGSAMIDVIEKNLDNKEKLFSELNAFASEIKSSCQIKLK